MSDYPDWQADNEPMRAALARLHHLHRTTGQMVLEAKEQFFATLQDSYFLIPNHGSVEEGKESSQFSFYFEPIEDELMLSVFSSVAEARAFFGEEQQLRRIIQSAPDFFGSIINMAGILNRGGNKFAGVILDRASENSYFFGIDELVSLASGGRVLGPAQQVSVEPEQVQISALPSPSSLSPALVDAFQEIMRENSALELREFWAFWISIEGGRDHLGLAIASELSDVLPHLGPLLEAKWREFGPKYAAFDLMPLRGAHETEIRANGTLLWRYEPPKKRSFWHFLQP